VGTHTSSMLGTESLTRKKRLTYKTLLGSSTLGRQLPFQNLVSNNHVGFFQSGGGLQQGQEGANSKYKREPKSTRRQSGIEIRVAQGSRQCVQERIVSLNSTEAILVEEGNEGRGFLFESRSGVGGALEENVL